MGQNRPKCRETGMTEIGGYGGRRRRIRHLRGSARRFVRRAKRRIRPRWGAAGAEFAICGSGGDAENGETPHTGRKRPIFAFRPVVRGWRGVGGRNAVAGPWGPLWGGVARTETPVGAGRPPWRAVGGHVTRWTARTSKPTRNRPKWPHGPRGGRTGRCGGGPDRPKWGERTKSMADISERNTNPTQRRRTPVTRFRPQHDQSYTPHLTRGRNGAKSAETPEIPGYGVCTQSPERIFRGYQNPEIARNARIRILRPKSTG